MKKYSPGEIVEIAFPYEDDTFEKVRPALVIRDYGDELVLLKIISRHKGREWDIEIPVDDFNGLSKASVIQVDKYRKVSKLKLSAIIPRGVINELQLGLVKSRLNDYVREQER